MNATRASRIEAHGFKRRRADVRRSDDEPWNERQIEVNVRNTIIDSMCRRD
jgi:hypothetical protein